ncbi:methyl-accepting chemotaxis protein [Thioclava sp. GXIMD4215]|uniref:methyl-accepting chemotaxis protein n=1 Tax=Thioclava sp. GXIMD4215 TaxID=3131928 RepID=UPI00324B749A
MKPFSNIRRFLGGIGPRLAFSQLVLVGILGSAIGMAWMNFQHFSLSMDRLSENRVPDLRNTNDIMVATNRLPEIITALLLADTPADIEQVLSTSDQQFKAFIALTQQLSQEDAALLNRQVAAFQGNIDSLSTARENAAQAHATMRDKLAKLELLVSQLELMGTPQARADAQALLRQIVSISFEGELIGLDRHKAAIEGQTKLLIFSLGRGYEDDVATLNTIIDPDTGVIAQRGLELSALQEASDAATAALKTVSQLSETAETVSDRALDEVSESANTLNSATDRATRMMEMATLAAIVVLVLTIGFLQFVLVRPLRDLTSRTRKLAEGDTDALEGAKRRAGELGAMREALETFRQNIVANRALEEQQREARAREAAEREAEAQRKLDAERAEMERQTRETQERMEREQSAAAEKQRLAAQAEAETAARNAEQAHVVRTLAEALGRLSHGDLTRRIDTAFPDSYEALRTDYNRTIDSLSHLVGSIQTSVSHILNNSAEVSQASSDLSHRTESAAATLEETAAAVEELAANTASAAENSRRTEKIVDSSKSETLASREIMAQAVAAMNSIAESSNRITRIIGVIDDIAFQTNLLALNAGVEAARAGDAGRGFAVVASEVRALAQRSSEAASEIGGLISESSQSVTVGVDLVGQTDTALQRIADSIAAIATNVSSVANSVEEQSHAVREINSATAQLDQMTQQNAAMFEETSAASLALSQEAQTLNEAITQFRVSTAQDTRSHAA